MPYKILQRASMEKPYLVSCNASLQQVVRLVITFEKTQLICLKGIDC